MAAIVDLHVLLSEMRPALREADYVYCCVSPEDIAKHLSSTLCIFREEQGVTLIVERSYAQKEALAFGPVMRCITLSVHSALEAVGLTAAVSAALTRHGISANVVAAYHHDHIFVPAGDAERALLALKEAAPVSSST
ncbi:ACT domain-containing protein [Pararhizobium arenae]|uniref:ACT domain-containing protein n=1 Tax=Pararhizobium arenae TaxID=1856850 RepID=UPI00094B065E|nr:ACT domain-containing protein [Pararhizobium arenae]